MRAVKLFPGDETAHLVEAPSHGYEPGSGKRFGVIEGPVDYRRLGKGWGMFFDDEFRAKKLPLNFMATVLYRNAGYASGQAICGPAILVGVTDDGSNTDLPQSALNYLALLGFTIVQEPG